MPTGPNYFICKEHRNSCYLPCPFFEDRRFPSVKYRPILDAFDATGGRNPIYDAIPYTATQVLEGQERARQAAHQLHEAWGAMVDEVVRALVTRFDLKHTYWGA